jgi:hypothetical protein
MDNKNIFQIIAEAVGNTNANVVDLYNLVKSQNEKIETIYTALFPTAAPTEDGATTNENQSPRK